MHKTFRFKAYELQYGPHFNEEYAHKAVSKMQNEDGSRGPHWSLEESVQIASQYNVNLTHNFNKYDWFVALNMVYSDYYKVIMNISNSSSTKHFVEFAKAWLNDRDIDEGKMWYYYIYVMCDKIREEEMECYEEHHSHDYDDYGRSRMYSMKNYDTMRYRDDDYEDDDYTEMKRRDTHTRPSVRYVRY